MLCYLRFFRIFDWIHVLGLVILGFTYASGSDIIFSYFLIAILIGSLYLAYGYSLNECIDARIDYNHIKIGKNSTISFPKGILVSHIILAINLIVALALSYKIFLLILSGSLMVFIYSVPPIRLKGVPLMGLLYDSLYFTLLFLIGFQVVKDLDLSAYLMAVFIFLLFLAVDLVHQLNDMEDDKLHSICTTAVRYGVKKTINLTIFCLIILILWTFLLWYYNIIAIYLFFLTLVYSLIIIFYLLDRFDKYKSRNTFPQGIKLYIRYCTMFYGGGIFVIFLLKNYSLK